MNAATENVLMAVESCDYERLQPTTGLVTAKTRPRLSVDEVSVILGLLVSDGLVVRRDDDPQAYELTARGRNHVESLW